MTLKLALALALALAPAAVLAQAPFRAVLAQEPQERQLKSPVSHMVTLIHIGKAGGSSIIREWLASDNLTFTFDEIHTTPVTEKAIKGKVVVISGRDPIERLISAYDWRHPRNCNSNRMCNDVHRAQELRFYACFPTIHDFVNGKKCSALHSDVINSRVLMGHINRGFQFHLKNVQQTTISPFYMVDTYTFDYDMACLRSKLSYRHSEGSMHVRTTYNSLYETLNVSERKRVAQWPLIQQDNGWYSWLKSNNELKCGDSHTSPPPVAK